jgi:MFS family permease
MGFVKNWQQLAALRGLLGVFEATLFPGAAYLISCWYPRRFMATRMSYFFIGAMFLQAFSGILAWGIGDGLHLKSGLHGWQVSLQAQTRY